MIDIRKLNFEAHDYIDNIKEQEKLYGKSDDYRILNAISVAWCDEHEKLNGEDFIERYKTFVHSPVNWELLQNSKGRKDQIQRKYQILYSYAVYTMRRILPQLWILYNIQEPLNKDFYENLVTLSNTKGHFFVEYPFNTNGDLNYLGINSQKQATKYKKLMEKLNLIMECDNRYRKGSRAKHYVYHIRHIIEFILTLHYDYELEYQRQAEDIDLPECILDIIESGSADLESRSPTQDKLKELTKQLYRFSQQCYIRSKCRIRNIDNFTIEQMEQLAKKNIYKKYPELELIKEIQETVPYAVCDLYSYKGDIHFKWNADKTAIIKIGYREYQDNFSFFSKEQRKITAELNGCTNHYDVTGSIPTIAYYLKNGKRYTGEDIYYDIFCGACGEAVISEQEFRREQSSGWSWRKIVKSLVLPLGFGSTNSQIIKRNSAGWQILKLVYGKDNAIDFLNDLRTAIYSFCGKFQSDLFVTESTIHSIVRGYLQQMGRTVFQCYDEWYYDGEAVDMDNLLDKAYEEYTSKFWYAIEERRNIKHCKEDYGEIIAEYFEAN